MAAFAAARGFYRNPAHSINRREDFMKGFARICFPVFALVVMLAGVAHAAVVELSLNLITPPGHLRNVHLFHPWIKQVEEKSGGTLKIVPHYSASLAPVNQAYECVVTGVADISEGNVYAMPGVFPLSEVIMLPDLGIGTKSQTYSANNWKAFKTVPAMANEWKDAKMLWMHTAPPTFLLMGSKPVRRIEDLRGLKLRISSSTSVRVGEQLGFAPVAMPISEIYQAVEKGVVDGVMTATEQLVSRRMSEVVKTVTMLPLVADSFFVSMNWDSWNKLSAEHKAVLESLSGDYAVEWSGKMWDDINEMAEKAHPEVEYITPTPEEMKRFWEALAPIKFEYADELEKKGLPARQVLNVMMGK